MANFMFQYFQYCLENRERKQQINSQSKHHQKGDDQIYLQGYIKKRHENSHKFLWHRDS